MTPASKALPIALLIATLGGCGAPAGNDAQPAATATPSAAAATPAPMPSPTPAAAVAAADAPAIAVDAEGFRLIDPNSGRTRPVPFGTSQADTLAAVAAFGPADMGRNAECGAGPIVFAALRNGLTLNFQDDRFVGWSTDAKAKGRVTTMAGIGPGSTRAALDDAYAITLPDSTLGTEFAAGDMGGLLDGTGASARITDLWAGTTCHFR